MKDKRIYIRISENKKDFIKSVAVDENISAYILNLIYLDLAKKGLLDDFLSL